MKADQSREFWQWFSSAAARIDKDPSNESVILEIDEQVSALGAFSWEIGPGVAKKWFFCISPSRDADLLSAAERLIAAAPKLDDWELLSAMPPKNWDHQFSMVYKGRPLSIDASGWKYVLHQYPDGVLDITMYVKKIPSIPEDVLPLVADIVAEGILGEQLMMSCVNDVEALDQAAIDLSPSASPIRDLLAHVRELCGPAT